MGSSKEVGLVNRTTTNMMKPEEVIRSFPLQARKQLLLKAVRLNLRENTMALRMWPTKK